MVLRPPVEKFPLTARKDIRDSWDMKKAGLEEQLSHKLGTAWQAEIDLKQLYAYAIDGYFMKSPGGMTHDAMEKAADQISDYVAKTGNLGIEALNTAAFKHVITMEIDETGTISSAGCDIKDGTLRILFHEECVGYNLSSTLERLKAAVDSAERREKRPLPFITRLSIRDEYETKIEEIKAKIATLVAMPEIQLVPNFEANYAAVEDSPEGRQYLQTMGYATRCYFEGLANHLERLGFGTDDMLQEGFQEGCSSGKIAIRVVEKLVHRHYNEVVVEDGVLYIQTVAKYWASNVDQPAELIMDIL